MKFNEAVVALEVMVSRKFGDTFRRFRTAHGLPEDYYFEVRPATIAVAPGDPEVLFRFLVFKGRGKRGKKDLTSGRVRKSMNEILLDVAYTIPVKLVRGVYKGALSDIACGAKCSVEIQPKFLEFLGSDQTSHARHLLIEKSFSLEKKIPE